MLLLQRMILSAALLGSIRSAKALVSPRSTRLSSSLRALGEVGTPVTSFDDGKRPYQITTPIYYVNDKPHIGHAYTSTGEFSEQSHAYS